jgi:hypothetical protein
MYSLQKIHLFRPVACHEHWAIACCLTCLHRASYIVGEQGMMLQGNICLLQTKDNNEAQHNVSFLWSGGPAETYNTTQYPLPAVGRHCLKQTYEKTIDLQLPQL